MPLTPLPPGHTSRQLPTVPFVRDLEAHGDLPAILDGDTQWTYRELASRVHGVARQLGASRKLVLIAGSNHTDDLVAYLAALRGGHVALLTPPAHADAVAATYQPDIVMTSIDGKQHIDIRRQLSAHELHPDLTLLMSTSGSTGSPKLVRLSHQNLQANAESIATYLGIRDTDRATTTLPMHYCYGLSVINSHLLRGAALVLTDLSVVDACFWELFRRHNATTFAGVPYTFELLDRIGFTDMHLPSLRYITQAGGRFAPDQVKRYAELGQQRGWDLFVMYGQTEATARMAYLPPDLARSHPGAIGVPVPGGSLSLDPLPDDASGTGELVYAGENVMLGYAETPADLALGRTVTSLRTGDIARRTPEGLYEIVGRRSRFVKIGGLRIDLQHLETMLTGQGITSCCAGSDGQLVIAVEGDHDPIAVGHRIARQCSLPKSAVHVYALDELPRLPNGKPDYRAVSELPGAASPAELTDPATVTEARPNLTDPDDLRDLFAQILGRPDATVDSTFVGLGGDSLSYVEMSVRLEEALGQVPSGWHTMPILELSQAARPNRSGQFKKPFGKWFGGRTVESSVLLRAVAIVCIVGTHAGLFSLLGGAHVLLAVAGFNFARFRLTDADRRHHIRQQLTSIARIAVPSMIWIAAVVALTAQYGPVNIVLLNGFLGSPTWTSEWHFWFIEILVYILLALAVLLAIPWVDRVERRHPMGFVAVLLLYGLLTRFEVIGIGVPYMLPAFWLFALGWASARATTRWQRIILTAVLAAAVPGFFGNPLREALVIGGVSLLFWTASIACPAPISRLAGILASSSLYIYLTHWQVYPRLTDIHPAVAVVGSMVVGVAAWTLARRFTAILHSRPYARQKVHT